MKTAVLVFILIIAGVLVWGFVGGNAAKDPGVTCDMGVGEALCWNWHTNTFGEIKEIFDDLGS